MRSGTSDEADVAGHAGWGPLVLLALIGALHGVWLVGPILWSVDAPFWKSPVGDVAVGVIGLEAFLQDGWHWPLAATGRLVADGEPVSIACTNGLPLPVHPPARAVRLELTAFSAVPSRPQTLAVVSGDRTLWEGELVAGQVRTIRVVVDPSASGSRHVMLKLHVGRPHSPASAGISSDGRLLGIGLFSIQWEADGK